MFVDLIMPNINGKKLIKVIRNIPKLKDVYIVILSAIVAEEEIDIAELGANTCIAKGPLKEMGGNILGVLDQPDLASEKCLSGKIIGIESVYPQIITEELLSVKRHSEIFLERMSEGIIEINSKGRILFANPTALSIFDMSEENLLGSYFIELFSEDERKRIVSLMETAIDKPKKINEDSPVCLKEYLITLDILPLQTEGHTYIIILNNVTERKKAEKYLRETNKFLKSILDSSFSISIVSTDLEGKILFWNKGAENIFGYKSEEILGRKINFLYHEDEKERVEKEIKPLVTNEKRETSCEVRQVTKGGRILWMKLNLSPRLDDGHVIGILGIGEDISERKQMQNELKKQHDHLKYKVRERTDELQAMVNAMADREIRMVELKKAIEELRAQIESEGLTPVVDDPLKEVDKDYT